MGFSTCLEHPSVHPQEDLYMQFCGISFMHPYKQCGRRQDVFDTHERNTIQLHVQVFLRMNTWMFETCRRHYNLIKILMKIVYFVGSYYISRIFINLVGSVSL